MSKQPKQTPAPPRPGPAMNTAALYALLGGLVAGGVIGYLLGAQTRSGSAPVPAVTAAAPGPMGGAPQAAAPEAVGLPSPKQVQQIAQLELIVQQDPKNHDAWVVLGNHYFDTHQHQKAIDAYAKALALKPGNPDILTDQGVMYRDTGQFDQALANFQQAVKLDPKHAQALFNIGVVYANDLHKPAEAEKAWKRVIEAAPASPQAAQAKAALEQLKSVGPARK